MSDSGGIAAVNARIAEIQSRFALTSPSRASAASGTFAAQLQAAQTTSGSGTAQKVIDIAKGWLGTPYVYGGNDPERGLDCSGLVQQAFRRVGIELPRVTYDQVKQGAEVADISQAKPGDLIFTVGDRGRRVNGHVGIYLGDGKWIEAPYTGANVRIHDVPKDITAIRRVIPDTSAAAPAGAAPAAPANASSLAATLVPMLAGTTSNTAAALSTWRAAALTGNGALLS